MRTPARTPEAALNAPYADDCEYLADELDKLDLLLRIRLAAFRRSWQYKPPTEGPSLYISDAEIDWVLQAGERLNGVGDAELIAALHSKQASIEARMVESRERGFFPALTQLATLFHLSPFETEVLLICLAPELRRSYDRVYAYLQDDVTRKRPSVDLVLDLLCETEADRWRGRSYLAPQAPLVHAGLLQPVDDPQSPSGSSGLAQFLRVDPRVMAFLLGEQAVDARLTRAVQLQAASHSNTDPSDEDGTKAALLSFIQRWASAESGWRPSVVVHLHGPRGVGKREVALALCGVLERPMLTLDAHALPPQLDEAESVLRLALRESILLQAPVYVSPASVFTGDSEAARALQRALGSAVTTYGWLVFLAGETAWARRDLFEPAVFYSASLPAPGFAGRQAAWRRTLVARLPDTPTGDLPERLAESFRLTPGQIREAADTLVHQRLVHGGPPVTFEVLAAACRAQAQHELGALASKVEPCHVWSDLVLPDETLAQLREMCSQARNEHRVYDQWGFGRRLSRGRGISGLFSGPPGTGKTMAVDVMAQELQLDLYKVDLARVVSKYIGETEKNLSRIFDEAERSNAVLFFDEADALFGKRTEISDAHDRYANIETSYLLQRMEEYAGIVILASNLRENMDDAFLRRLRFHIEFPFPDSASRLQIWQKHFPREAPVSEDVDYAWLAQRLPIAGGNIRNIVLNAAFLAAADGGVIRAGHVLRGARREYEKIGKLWTEDGLTWKK